MTSNSDLFPVGTEIRVTNYKDDYDPQEGNIGKVKGYFDDMIIVDIEGSKWHRHFFSDNIEKI